MARTLFTITTEDGIIVRTGECEDTDLSLQAGAGEVATEGHPPGAPHLYYLRTGNWTPRAERPADHFEFDPVDNAWEDQRTLGMAKIQAVRRMRAAQDEQINGGFLWGGYLFDSDASSRASLTALAFAATQPGWTDTDVTLKDNTSVTLTGTDALAVAATMKNGLGALMTLFKIRLGQIAACTTNAAADAIVW